MKKFFFFALVATMFAACTTDAVNEQAVKIEDLAPETITVSFESGDSRIQLNEAGKTVWTEGDLVSVFYRSNANQKWQFQGKTGDRSGDLKRVEMGTATESMNRVVVVYPYNESYYLNPETYNVEASLPASQNYLKDSYGVGSNIMISSGEYNQFSLKSVCGMLKIQLTGAGEKIKSISLKGNNGEQVAGQLYINSSDATSTLASKQGVADDGENTAGGNLVFEDTILKEVTLDCGEGVELGAEPTAFYIALPPQTFEKGISLKIASTDGLTMTKSTEKEVVIERNHILPMAPFEIEMEEPKLANNEIWYTSTDGAVVEPTATNLFGSASIVSNTYENGKGVITFDGEVTSIGNKAFYERSSLTSITIPNSVTSIGNYAFRGCTSLTSVTIPDSVTKIGGDAFSSCTSLTSITIPDSVTSIGDDAFFGCISLTSITIPNSVTSIGNYTFSGCSSLTSVTIPDSVTSIGESAFNQCSSLTSVTIGNGVTSIGNDAFSSCKSLTSITIPDSVTSIGSYAFSGCTGELKVNCNIPSASSSDHGAFYNSKFTKLTIGNSVTSIGSYAFSGCNSLTSITIPNSVTSIGDSAFSGCSSLIIITIHDDSVTSIGEYAFSYCSNLKSVTIGNSVTSIGGYAFSGCSSLTSVTIGNSVTSIGYEAFSFCTSLARVTIPDSVTLIGGSAFASCTSLTRVTIGDSVTSIGGYAFYHCSSLTSVTIPDSVTSIGGYAFSNCSRLTSVYCKPTTPPTGNSDMFYKNIPGRKIYVPSASVEAYKAASYWSNYASDIEGYEF